MLRKSWYFLQNSVAGGAVIIAVFSILSRVFGLLRDRLLSSNFGAGQTLDAYYAAFRLPDLIFNTLVLGALSSAFIPIFLSYWQRNKDEAWRIANSVLNVLLILISGLVIVLFIFAPFFVYLMVPGFNQPTRLLTINLTRIMLISVLFFTFSNLFGGILNSFRRFLAYSLAPVMYNLGIIFGILFLVPPFGLAGLAWGVVFGAFLHLLVQWIAAHRTGFRWQLALDYLHPGVKKIGLLMLPRCFGLAISQFNLIVTTLIASFLVVGAVAIYNLAFNLISFPINIFGTSLAIAVFPVFSQTLINGQIKEFIYHFSKTVRRILYLIIPISFIYILLRAQIVRLVLGAGLFSWRDTVLTAEAVGFFSLSLFAQALIPVLARAFYAQQDTKTPVKVALICLVINLVGGIILAQLMGIGGLALAFSLSSIINLALLISILNRRFGNLDLKKIINSLIKIIFFSILMAGIVQLVKYQIAPLVNMQTFVGVLIQFLCAVGIGGLVYLILSLIFRFEEVIIIKEQVLRLIKRKAD